VRLLPLYRQNISVKSAMSDMKIRTSAVIMTTNISCCVIEDIMEVRNENLLRVKSGPFYFYDKFMI
jgi:hypothetical protein